MAEQSFAITLRETLEARQDDIMKTLAGSIDPERFIRVALLAVTKNKKLWQCSKESVLLAVMDSARTGLLIDNKEAALVPYNNQAEFMPMVKGIINLMLRSPGLLKVEARAVYEGDEFDFQYGLKPQLIHRPKGEQGQVTHAYAIAWRQGTEPTFEVMDREEIERARNTSRAPNSPAWANWYGEMARKVVLKRLAKYIDLSPEATRAIEIDHAVTGDPWGSDYVEVDPEMQNRLVKTHTQASIARLKDRMADPPDELEGGDQDEEMTLAKDAPTMFWDRANHLIKQEVITKQIADEIVANNDNNFVNAYDEITARYLPPEADDAED